MLKLAIIIVNYGTAELTTDCLNSISKQIDQSTTNVIVVDNCSDDNSVALISDHINKQSWQTWCKLIVSDKNGGFSYGNNFGIKNVEAETYFLLNSDTIILEDSLKSILEQTNNQKGYGMFSVNLRAEDRTLQISHFKFHSPISELIDAAQTGIITKALSPWNVPLSSIKNAEWISFAAVVIRKEVFDKIGLLDDKYFMYYEDVDFCRRAKLAKVNFAHIDSCNVIHLCGKSSPESHKKRPASYYYKSRARYFCKFYKGRTGLLIANLLWTIGWSIFQIRVLLGKKDGWPKKNQFFDNWIGL